jgi:hypothetical protein
MFAVLLQTKLRSFGTAPVSTLDEEVSNILGDDSTSTSSVYAGSK